MKNMKLSKISKREPMGEFISGFFVRPMIFRQNLNIFNILPQNIIIRDEINNPENIDQLVVANNLQHLEMENLTTIQGIRPPKFDRKSGEVRLFFQKFDFFFKLRPNWNDRNKVEYFANLIDGECLDFYDTLYDPEAIDINYENIKNDL